MLLFVISCIYGKQRSDDGATPAAIYIYKKRGGISTESGSENTLNDYYLKIYTGHDPILMRRMRTEMMKAR